MANMPPDPRLDPSENRTVYQDLIERSHQLENGAPVTPLAPSRDEEEIKELKRMTAAKKSYWKFRREYAAIRSGEANEILSDTLDLFHPDTLEEETTLLKKDVIHECQQMTWAPDEELYEYAKTEILRRSGLALKAAEASAMKIAEDLGFKDLALMVKKNKEKYKGIRWEVWAGLGPENSWDDVVVPECWLYV